MDVQLVVYGLLFSRSSAVVKLMVLRVVEMVSSLSLYLPCEKSSKAYDQQGHVPIKRRLYSANLSQASCFMDHLKSNLSTFNCPFGSSQQFSPINALLFLLLSLHKIPFPAFAFIVLQRIMDPHLHPMLNMPSKTQCMTQPQTLQICSILPRNSNNPP
ncbi:hypothetical protein OCU04_005334 [Sclerotinia nivalis]|uniref:Uncharacterized protein n=1 Tax=Sclerotinia nivalis TaxID=352851 RepID=A0A9X0ANX8_9HELO|nr:hypothetical protein OCU04_005334 [Sclerotinia nivalis]